MSEIEIRRLCRRLKIYNFKSFQIQTSSFRVHGKFLYWSYVNLVFLRAFSQACEGSLLAQISIFTTNNTHKRQRHSTGNKKTAQKRKLTETLYRKTLDLNQSVLSMNWTHTQQLHILPPSLLSHLRSLSIRHMLRQGLMWQLVLVASISQPPPLTLLAEKCHQPAVLVF